MIKHLLFDGLCEGLALTAVAVALAATIWQLVTL